MTQQVADRVWETTATTGTGTYSLAGAKTGYRAFSTICSNNDTVYYTVTDGTNWEVGKGTYGSGGNTLARTTILASSNSGAAVSWGAGSKDIYITIAANFFTSGSAGNQLVSNGNAEPTFQFIPKVPIDTRDPTIFDDASLGYLVNDYWVNRQFKRIWQCYVNTTGAARWQELPWNDAPVLDQVPTALANCVYAGGLRRLYSGYIGPLADVTRASDSTTLTLPFVGAENVLDAKLLDQFIAGTTGGYSKLYDQSGNGNDLAQATAANQPIADTFEVEGQRTVSFQGVQNGLPSHWLHNAASPSTTINAVSSFFVSALLGTSINTKLCAFGDVTAQLFVLSSAGYIFGVFPATSSSNQFGIQGRSGEISVLGMTSGASNVNMFANDKSFTVTGNEAATGATGYVIGDNTGAPYSGGGYPADMDMLANFVFSKELTSTEVDLLKRACYMNFPGIVPQCRTFLDWIGDSRCVGYLATNNKNYPILLRNKLAGPVGNYNFGAPSASTTTWVNQLSGFYTAVLYSGEKHVVTVELGGNDLISSVALATIQANLVTIVSGIRSAAASAGASVLIGVTTLLESTAITGGNEANRVSLNTWLRTLSNTGADFLLDQDSDPTLQSADGNTLYYPDGTHFTSLAHDILADQAVGVFAALNGFNWRK